MGRQRDDRVLAWLDGLAEGVAGGPGLAVSVTRGARVVGQRYAGLASLSHRIPIGPHTRFHVVSISKTFMAASVLVLAARGAVALDDDVRRHIPELPAEVCRHGAVTVRHLLSMTSGLRDVLEIERLRGVWTASPSRARDLLDLALRQSAVSAPPGAQYMYANVNAVLLEELVARASGMSAEAFRRTTLYEPLGLVATCARPHDGIVLPDLAEPYVSDGAAGWTRAASLLGIAADPLTTTLEDLTRWLLALRAGTVAGVEVRRAMATRTRLADGTPICYGLGLAVRRYRGLTVLCHTGSQPGYKAHIAYVPERDVGLAIVSNREDTHPTALAAEIMERAIGDDFPAAHPARAMARRPSGEWLRSRRATTVDGVYADPESGEWVAVAGEEGGLRVDTLGDPVFLYPHEDGAFRDGDDYRSTVPAELRFAFGRGEEDVTCRLDLGGQVMALRRFTAPVCAAAALDALAGVYESTEISSRHGIRVEDGALMVDYGLGDDAQRAFPMEPITPDMFLVRPTGPGVAYRHVFRFERDHDGAVRSAVVTMERLKGVRLWRRPDAPGPRAGQPEAPRG